MMVKTTMPITARVNITELAVVVEYLHEEGYRFKSTSDAIFTTVHFLSILLQTQKDKKVPSSIEEAHQILLDYNALTASKSRENVVQKMAEESGLDMNAEISKTRQNVVQNQQDADNNILDSMFDDVESK